MYVYNNHLVILYRCVPLPEDNLCRAFGIDAYAIDVSSQPEVVIFQNMVVTLVEDYRVVRVCTPFLNASLCGSIYIPCNTTLQKLVPICENDCKQITQAIDACIDFLNENADSLAASSLTAVANSYNCSNPATYVPTVPNNFYSSQEACRQFVYDTNITTEGIPVIAVNVLCIYVAMYTCMCLMYVCIYM